MLESLETHVGKGNFILEKASIDELFLDVTKHCYRFNVPAWNDQNNCKLVEDLASKETVICAEHKFHFPSDESIDDDIRALRRGCIIARGLRKSVFDRLGFTLSAGVADTKLVSKLCASYGKPNGQAVVFPPAISSVMEDTKIRKARNLGGKIGKEVMKLLPPNEDSMGSIARLLSLEQLCSTLGPDIGTQVWNASRGIDDEPVRETKRALTKSITAFKSFTVRNDNDVPKWIALLSVDLVARVQADTHRNSRSPTNCTIQYYFREGGQRDRIGKSVRIPFPKPGGAIDQNEVLTTKVKEVLESKIELRRIVRLGLCATQFQERARKGISTFFGSQVSSSQGMKSSTCKAPTPISDKRISIASHFQLKTVKEPKISAAAHTTNISSLNEIPKTPRCDEKVVELHEDGDLAYARKLQKMFDRENSILSSPKQKYTSSSGTRSAVRSKKMRIDSFFNKVKK